jgi:hypothetical protein
VCEINAELNDSLRVTGARTQIRASNVVTTGTHVKHDANLVGSDVSTFLDVVAFERVCSWLGETLLHDSVCVCVCVCVCV